MGLLNVLECCARTGVRKVVFAASGGTLYGEPRRLPVKETASGRPSSPYGITKKVALDYLAFYETSRGLPYTALALANVYGPRQDPNGEAGVIAIFTSKMLAGEAPTIFGDGDQTRDYVFVDDTVHAFALAAGRRRRPSRERRHRPRDLGERPVPDARGASRGSPGSRRTGPRRAGDLRRSALDPELASSVLGWRPWTHLEDGLRETIAFMRGL